MLQPKPVVALADIETLPRLDYDFFGENKFVELCGIGESHTYGFDWWK